MINPISYFSNDDQNLYFICIQNFILFIVLYSVSSRNFVSGIEQAIVVHIFIPKCIINLQKL